jgi:hypothetical protein
VGSRCREGGEEVSSTWQNDMLARKVADSTYGPRAYLAVGLGKKSRRQQSTRMRERAGREGSMEWFGGQSGRVQVAVGWSSLPGLMPDGRWSFVSRIPW